MRRKLMGYASVLAILATLFLFDSRSRGDLLYVCNQGAGTVGVYRTDGTVVNPNLITGLAEPEGIAIVGSDLYVASFGTVFAGGGTIGKYTTAGGVINPSLITGLTQPQSVAVLGSDLFVGEAGGSRIRKYTTDGASVNPNFISATSPEGVTISGASLLAINVFNSGYRVSQWDPITGATLNANFITGVGQSYGMTADASDVYVVQSGEGTVGKYDALTGAPVNTSLISGIPNGYDAAVSGSDLYVDNFYPDSTIGHYTTSGATVNASLFGSGLNRPYGMAIAPESALPEPGAAAAAILAAGVFLRRWARST